MRKVGRWAKRHPFWAFIIALFMVSWLLGSLGLVDAFIGGGIAGLLCVIRGLVWINDKTSKYKSNESYWDKYVKKPDKDK